MPSLTIPDVPEAALAALRDAAAASGMSVGDEILTRLQFLGPRSKPPDPKSRPPSLRPGPIPRLADERGEVDPQPIDTPLPDGGVRRQIGLWTFEYGPVEHPDGLEPRRYPIEMSDACKREKETWERRVRDLPSADFSAADLEAAIREVRDR